MYVCNVRRQGRALAIGPSFNEEDLYTSGGDIITNRGSICGAFSSSEIVADCSGAPKVPSEPLLNTDNSFFSPSSSSSSSAQSILD